MDQTTALELENLALRLEGAAEDAADRARGLDAEALKHVPHNAVFYHNYKRDADRCWGEDFGLRQAAATVQEMLKRVSQ